MYQLAPYNYIVYSNSTVSYSISVDISDPGFDEAAARLELIQLKKRVAELEKKLATKSRGLQFKVGCLNTCVFLCIYI